MFARPLSLAVVGQVLICPTPILPYLVLIVGAVMAAAAVRSVDLGAVMVMMLLVGLQVIVRPSLLTPVVRDTARGFDRLGDDLLPITASMSPAGGGGDRRHRRLCGFGGGHDGAGGGGDRGHAAQPVVAGDGRVHPIITGTVVLAALASQP